MVQEQAKRTFFDNNDIEVAIFGCNCLKYFG